MRIPERPWLLATFALAGGCSDPIDPSETPKQVTVTVGADGADLAALVRAYPEGTAFHLGSGVYRTSSPVTPKTGDGFVGDSGAIASGKNFAVSLTSADSRLPR